MGFKLISIYILEIFSAKLVQNEKAIQFPDIFVNHSLYINKHDNEKIEVKQMIGQNKSM
jgi:hypothetical protein